MISNGTSDVFELVSVAVPCRSSHPWESFVEASDLFDGFMCAIKSADCPSCASFVSSGV